MSGVVSRVGEASRDFGGSLDQTDAQVVGNFLSQKMNGEDGSAEAAADDSNREHLF
jgi:hypothetical protein